MATTGDRREATPRSTTAEKLEQLERLQDEAAHAGDERAVGASARARQAARPGAARAAARPGQLRRARPLRPPPQPALRDDGAPSVGRRGGDRLRDDPRPQGLRLLAGFHGLRRDALGGVRREDLQGHGPGAQVRVPGDRDQRLGRCAHSGGRRLPGRLRGDLLAQRPGLGGRCRRSAWSWARARAAPSIRPR